MARLLASGKDTSHDVDLVEFNRTKAAFMREAGMVDRHRVNANDVATHRVEGDLIVPHHDEIQRSKAGA
ncbi:MAG: hypothetical protein R3E66_15625 [bacterium]